MREALDKALNELIEESLRMLSLVRQMTQEPPRPWWRATGPWPKG